MVGEMKCATCGGRGWVWDAHLNLARKVKDQCFDCGGSGKMESE